MLWVKNKDKVLGQACEKTATSLLTINNYVVLETNWRCAIGELDIIALRPRTLCFIEVKGRNIKGKFKPVEAISDAKIQKLDKLSLLFAKKRYRLIKKHRINTTKHCIALVDFKIFLKCIGYFKITLDEIT